jgi:hypothetical protein
MRYRAARAIKGEGSGRGEDIFDIYERHTDITVKGKRDAQGADRRGRGNLILPCEIAEGNPKDSGLFQDTIEAVKKAYGKAPNSSVADGGYASSANMKYAQEEGIVNIVFYFPRPIFPRPLR